MPTEDDNPIHLLARYFAGECSWEEEQRVEAWIGADPSHAAHVDAARHVWELTGRTPEKEASSYDAERAFARFEKQIRPEPPMPQRSRAKRSPDRRAASGAQPVPASERADTLHAGQTPAEDARRRRPSRWRVALQTAAVLLAAGLTALLALYLTGSPSAPSVRVVATGPGERARVQLGDGSAVRLNVDSRLVFPASFDGEQRRVELEGEAFFDVASDSSKPFVVDTRGVSVEVLGTAFDVRAYAADREMQVVVSEGRVAVRDTVGGGRTVTLTRGQRALLKAGVPTRVERGVSVDRYLAWTEGRLVFDDTPLYRVARELERWYALEVTLADSAAIASRTLTTAFEKAPLSEILRVTTGALGLSYRTSGPDAPRHVILAPSTDAPRQPSRRQH